MGNELLQVTGQHETVDIWMVRKKDTIHIIITNWALPRHPIKTEWVKVQIDNIKKVKASFIERLDDNHANARKTWTDMGSPGSLSANDVYALELASALVIEPLTTRLEKGSVFVEITILPQGVAYITVET
ncbi:MAG: hypothetical protein ABI472_16025 [Ginsengibacter sp.]